MEKQGAVSKHEGSQPAVAGFMDITIQQQIEWRDGDIVISVPMKSGTTWMMNIVHQLRSGGDANFYDIYKEVPWLEVRPRPDSRTEDLVAEFNAMGRERRRGLKTHAGPDVLPYQPPSTGTDVSYIVVVRNPDEAIASIRPFMEAHSDAWFAEWQISRETFLGPDLETFLAERSSGLIATIFGFVAAWWPLRHEPNVLLLHFADLKRAHEQSVRRVADFLDFTPTTSQWSQILEYTSFPWMKAHEEKFEARSIGDVLMLDSGAMIRKGKLGTSAEDGITEAVSKTIAERGRHVLRDEQAFEWCYRGGPVPS